MKQVIAELEKDYLELSGFEVETEKDGKVGLERVLKHEKYDLLILDLMLPGVDGFEICQKGAEQRRTLRSSWYRPRRMILIRFSGLGHGCG